MIVLNMEKGMFLFEQHHHALVSGIMAMHWRFDGFLGEHLREQVEYAVAQHDRAWIPLDGHPIWNDDKQQPYSFIDYPMKEKMVRYQEGVDQVEMRSNYGGLLCSLHYRSFFPEVSEDESIQAFISDEEARQKKLKNELGEMIGDEQLNFHFDLLQFCDDLSLYCCMNEPGVTKEEELSWFRDGFPQRFNFAPDGIVAYWDGKNAVALEPFPFQSTFQVDIPFRELRPEQIEEVGFPQAWKESVLHNRTIKFVPR
ncbi:DUF3891 family protein [Pontibacillus marinus]|uniref:Serine hydroxymethyltransferase n=1 Tax=Pontibacillus marinus BH030004 = DSM 16465 TaxID=1385511 RepID=A0A0A5HTK8_9BACI|nr:DUF3891 family protein [Pontibacillus marinus]KGX86952.1 serine hydroxymethyltransferase [Pontibacillus marinus BH030004 = DSM 16465]